MNLEQNEKWLGALLARAKQVAQQLEDRIRELMGDEGKGPPSSAAMIERSALGLA